MNILVVGSGAREHALAWKLAKSENVKHIYVAPGNAGTSTERKCENINISAEDIKGLCAFARDNKIDLTVVGPEKPLAFGIVDLFEVNNLKIIGPSKQAAQIEASKYFAKLVMEKAGIKTAQYERFSDSISALNYIKNKQFPQVIKYNGLAAGKGVTIVNDLQEAKKVLNDIFVDKRFGENGDFILIEEFLKGEEVSFIALTDGKHIMPFIMSKDHKAIFDDDKGPNTGGMGAYCPVPQFEETRGSPQNQGVPRKIKDFVGKRRFYGGEMYNIITETIMEPLIKTLSNMGIIYRGFIYAGLIITDGIPTVLEFNCRLGDPEAQPILMKLNDDFLDILQISLSGNLHKRSIKWHDGFAITVVMASGGYPNDYKKGFEIKGLEKIVQDDHLKVFHAGTKLKDGKYITDGGRVLSVTSMDKDVEPSINKVYGAINMIDFENAYYRKDIGKKALKRS